MSINPYESPRAIDGPHTVIRDDAWPRRLLTDTLAGAFVGTAYGSLGMGVMLAVRASTTMVLPGIWSRIEQFSFSLVAGALGGAVLGCLFGGLAGGILGTIFRWFRWQKSRGFYWAAVLLGAVTGSLLGVAGAMIMTPSATATELDAVALVEYPVGGVLGGMLGALSGRKWLRMVSG